MSEVTGQSDRKVREGALERMIDILVAVDPVQLVDGNPDPRGEYESVVREVLRRIREGAPAKEAVGTTFRESMEVELSFGSLESVVARMGSGIRP